MGNDTSQPDNTLVNNITIELKSREIPAQFPCRDGHCSASSGSKLFIYGGVQQTELQVQGNEVEIDYNESEELIELQCHCGK